MHLAATISEHPVVAHAVGECIGDLMERRGDSPDLLVVVVTDRLGGAMEDITAVAASLLKPRVMLGVPAPELAVGSRASLRRGALGMLAVWHSRPSAAGGQVTVEPEWRVRSAEPVAPVRIASMADLANLSGRTGTLFVFTDASTQPVAAMAERLAALAPDLTVIAASSDSVRPRPGAGLFIDGDSHHDGAAGVLFPTGFPQRLVSSFGFVPVGVRFEFGDVATAGDASRIGVLGGRTAKEALDEVLGGLTPEERTAATGGLHVQWIPRAERGCSVPRYAPVLGTDGGSVVVAGEPPPGAGMTQFQVRDEGSREADLVGSVGANADLVGGLFLIVERPDGPSTGIGQVGATLSNETARSDFLGIPCGDVVLVDRGDVVPAGAAVTILGLVDRVQRISAGGFR